MAKLKRTRLASSQKTDIKSKKIAREALAEGFITLAGSTLRAIADEKIAAGEVLNTARVAGILAAKRCGEIIPLANPLPLESVEVEFDLPVLEPLGHQPVRLRIKAVARIAARKGVEMEALTAVCAAALTIYDMCKAIDKTMIIGDIRLMQKTGGNHRPK